MSIAPAVAFLAAFLTFWLELAVAKALLPRFGGSAYVWTTCVMLFQALLLAAYGSSRAALAGRRPYGRVHLAVLLLPLAFFPLRLAGAPTGCGPFADLAWAVLRSVGVPFVVLSTTVPVIQSWLRRSSSDGRDGYHLYAASNAGALTALFAYPLLIEPLLPLKIQSFAWCGLYAAYAVLHASLLPAESAVPAAAPSDAAAPPGRLALWMLSAAAPCAAMLATSNMLNLDFAAVPLMWTAPLAVYLLTFVLNFKREPWYPGRLNSALLPILGAWAGVCLILAMLAVRGSAESTPVQTLRRLMDIGKFGYVIASLFIVGMICHRALSGSRPSAEREMPAYYGWIAAGGLLGSLSVGVLVPWLGRDSALLGMDWVVAGVLAVSALAARDWGGLAARVRRRPGPAAAGAAALILGGAALAVGRATAAADSSAVFSLRNFYGVYRVVDKDGMREFFHGNTDHGMQSLDPAKARVPLTYYNPRSPLAEAYASLGRDWRSIGVVGLGAGAIAAYGRSGQTMDFYELDPDVAMIAARWFTYLKTSPAATTVIVGDARLSLQKRERASYDLLILDAFNSGAVPIHLLTKEALELDLTRVARGGVVLLHVSNRYLDLRPMLASMAEELGLRGASKRLVQHGRVVDDRVPSSWVALSRDPAKIETLIREQGWSDLAADSRRSPAWTDQHASLLRVLAF